MLRFIRDLRKKRTLFMKHVMGSLGFSYYSYVSRDRVGVGLKLQKNANSNEKKK